MKYKQFLEQVLLTEKDVKVFYQKNKDGSIDSVEKLPYHKTKVAGAAVLGSLVGGPIGTVAAGYAMNRHLKNRAIKKHELKKKQQETQK